MIGWIARIWAKRLVHWTLFDLVGALVLISLASVASGAVLDAIAILPTAVPVRRRTANYSRWRIDRPPRRSTAA
jgi:hypothetical protein